MGLLDFFRRPKKQIGDGENYIDEKKAERMIKKMLKGKSVSFKRVSYTKHNLVEFFLYKLTPEAQLKLFNYVSNQVDNTISDRINHMGNTEDQLNDILDAGEIYIYEGHLLHNILKICQDDKQRLSIVNSFSEDTRRAILMNPELVSTFDDAITIVNTISQCYNSQDGDVLANKWAKLANLNRKKMNGALNEIFSDKDKATNYIVQLLNRADSINPSALVDVIRKVSSNPEVMQPEHFCNLFKRYCRNEDGSYKVSIDFLKSQMAKSVLSQYQDKDKQIGAENVSDILDRLAEINRTLDNEPSIMGLEGIKVYKRGVVRGNLFNPQNYLQYARDSKKPSRDSKDEQGANLKDIMNEFEEQDFPITALLPKQQEELIGIITSDVRYLDEGYNSKQKRYDIDKQIEGKFGIKKGSEFYDRLVKACAESSERSLSIGVYYEIGGPCIPPTRSYFKARYIKEILLNGKFKELYGKDPENKDEILETLENFISEKEEAEETKKVEQMQEGDGAPTQE